MLYDFHGNILPCFPVSGIPLPISILSIGVVCTFYTALVSDHCVCIQSRGIRIAYSSEGTLIYCISLSEFHSRVSHLCNLFNNFNGKWHNTYKGLFCFSKLLFLLELFYLVND